jgi:hypothetical protein
MTESRHIDPEEDAFNHVEMMSRIKQETVKASVEGEDKKYLAGWNAALELAAFEIEHMKGFGQDTIQSFATYIRGMKR